ncbi:MAG: hypothetical protein II393_00715 [Cytophagales bacterium]|nr:hypothetical protein [Cytophagales bacterium]MBQ5918998.1 hypothetical protein [Lachnospiraceae bacterium]
MNIREYKIHKDKILEDIKQSFYYTNRLTEKQWKDLMIDLQDIMYDIGFVYQTPRRLYSDGCRELNPDMADIINETNRRLNDG